MKAIGSRMWKWCAGLGLAAALWGQPQLAVADLSEGFETGMPTSYATGDYALGSGTWSLVNVIRGTTKYAGSYSCQLRSSTGAQARTPTLAGGVGTITFWVYSSIAAGGLQVNLSTDDGANWTPATGSPFTGLGSAWAQKTIVVNNASVNKVQFYRTAGTISLDEVVITSNSGSSAPSVTTVAASGIGTTAATANGNVTADGGETVTERGVCYKTSAGVAITDNPTAAAAGGTGEFSVDLASLSVNQIYYFKAYAINSVGTTLSDTELDFTTLANVPAAPTVGNPTVSTLDVTVNEDGNPASTEYAIQRTSDSQYLQADGTWGASEAWQTQAAWGTLTATGLAPSTEYFFQVKARNGASVETAFGTSASGTTAEGIVAPSVTTVAASGIGATAATANGNVTDDGGDTVTERGVCYKTTAGVAITDNPTAAAAAGTGEFSVDLASLSVNQIYYFKAYAINSVGTTLSATELDFTTLANVPAAPTVDNPTETTLDVTVNGNGNPAATEFAIQRTSDSQYLQADGTWGASEAWQTQAAWGTLTATGLAPSTEYFFQVKARNGANVETAFSDTGSNTTATPCEPDAPTGLGAVPDYTSFTASWNAADRATGYRLDVSTEEDFQVGGNGELIISEVADPLDVANAKYVELYNGTGAAIDFSTATWYLARQANGGSWANTLLTGVIPAGGTYVVAYNQTSYETAFGTAADQYSGNMSGNGDDGYFLVQGGGYSTGTVVDAYGVIDQDGSGYAWEYLDKNAIRNADVAAPNATWTASEWTIPGTTVNTADMDPDAHTCTGDQTPSFVSGFGDLAVAGTSQLVTGLDEGTTYYFRVRAEGEGGCPSENSATAEATTLLHLRVEVSRTAVNVREGGEGRFYVRLNKDPEGTLVVATARSAGDATLAVQSGAALSFNSLNWSTWRAVTLSATAAGTATFSVSAAGVDSQDVTATVMDQTVGANHALASSGASIAGYAATRMDLAIDGIHAQRANYGTVCWLNTDPDGTMTLDLQDIIALSNVRILNWDFSYRTQQYEIESSLDGTTWTPLVDASTGEHVGWEDWAVSGAARYLRFTGLGNSADMPVLVAEWEVYGEVVPQPEIQVSKSAINVREAGEGRFWVRLASAPLANFTVGAVWDSGDAGITVLSGATLVFTPSDWNVWKPVVLAAAADEDDENETAQIQMYAAGLPAGVFVTATALDGDIGANLALASGGATISGVSALRPAMAIDGIHADRANYACTTYLNVEPDGTMTLDLQAETELGRIRLLNWDWIYRTQGYVIESSTDGETWAPLVDASTGDHIGWEDWEVSATARYLRFTGLYNSASKPVIVAELEVYGPPVARRSLAPAKGGSVVAESEPISVLTSDGPEDETGWNAVDGDAATAWVGQKAGGGYVVVEYAPALELSGLEVDLTEGSLAEIEVLTSLDAEDWQPLPEDLEANPVSLNFLWLVFPDDGTDAVPSVIEIRPNP